MLPRTLPRRAWTWQKQLCPRYSSAYASTTSTPSAPTAPPMLRKIRADMKTAMQAKDTTRLAVLRNLLTQTINASKTSNPLTTDVQMLALLRKNVAASKAAAEEFRTAGRADLAEKEDGQLKIMEEYAGGVETVGEEEVRRVVGEVVEGLRKTAGSGGKGLPMGEVLKKVFAPEVLGEKPVERGDVVRIVKEVLGASSPTA